MKDRDAPRRDSRKADRVIGSGGVTQKLTAQAVPLIGALGGAAVNYAFIDHFQDVARAHFVVRKLERRYGVDTVREAYERLPAQVAA